MQVFQTAGVPPSSGSTILAIIGWTTKSSDELRKSVMAKSRTTRYDGQTVCPQKIDISAKAPQLSVRFSSVDYGSDGGARCKPSTQPSVARRGAGVAFA